MSEQTKNLLGGNYNPDVLECLANLSNDEVFTPPKVVNNMLDMLPEETWSNPNLKFLDPACKTGVFLREIAKRLIVGLADQIPDLRERLDHIFKEQLYGIAITELTALASRRSLYCSKYANGKYAVGKFDNPDGNIRFVPINHTWEGGRCKYCGASEEQYQRDGGLETHAYEFIHTNNPEEIFNMKFDVIIGNPPYQLNDGGGTGSSARPIYQYFVRNTLKLKPKYSSLVIPSRWFAGGKGLDDFRDEMLNLRSVRTIIDYADAAECFPGVTIAGGVCYYLIDSGYSGNCEIVNMKKGEIQSSLVRPLNEYSVFIRDNISISIIRKIQRMEHDYMDSIVSSRNVFSLLSEEVGHEEEREGDLVLYSRSGKSYIEPSRVRKTAKIDSYSVIMTKAMSGGNKPSSTGDYLVISETMKILKPGEVCTETFLCVGDFDNEIEAENLMAYMQTKFFRFLLLQALTSINISKDKFQFIPLLDFKEKYTDDYLFKKYSLTDEEIGYIKTLIKTMGDK